MNRLPSRDLAGSGSRPLTNIPHCCLPQESGPCLSTSVGGQPLSPPIHRRLGEPLPHQLSNGPHVYLLPINLYSHTHASLRNYTVLARLSPCYPIVRGKLHTCYAPVRRSPPKYCYLALPLDLHVLSLSLAFILSQDQTLHCYLQFLFSSFQLLG